MALCNWIAPAIKDVSVHQSAPSVWSPNFLIDRASPSYHCQIDSIITMGGREKTVEKTLHFTLGWRLGPYLLFVIDKRLSRSVPCTLPYSTMLTYCSNGNSKGIKRTNDRGAGESLFFVFPRPPLRCANSNKYLL